MIRDLHAHPSGVHGAKLLAQIPDDRFHLGSHAPFIYFESAKLKLQSGFEEA